MRVNKKGRRGADRYDLRRRHRPPPPTTTATTLRKEMEARVVGDGGQGVMRGVLFF
jgi:hypothetical protein